MVELFYIALAPPRELLAFKLVGFDGCRVEFYKGFLASGYGLKATLEKSVDLPTNERPVKFY